MMLNLTVTLIAALIVIKVLKKKFRNANPESPAIRVMISSSAQSQENVPLTMAVLRLFVTCVETVLKMLEMDTIRARMLNRIVTSIAVLTVTRVKKTFNLGSHVIKEIFLSIVSLQEEELRIMVL
jgi:hypothetical protein